MKSPELSCIIIMWQNNGDVVHIMQVWLAKISHSHLFWTKSDVDDLFVFRLVRFLCLRYFFYSCYVFVCTSWLTRCTVTLWQDPKQTSHYIRKAVIVTDMWKATRNVLCSCDLCFLVCSPYMKLFKLVLHIICNSPYSWFLL